MLKKVISKFKKGLKKRNNKSDQDEPDATGTSQIFGKTFNYHHKMAFIRTYDEIIKKEIYHFNPKNEHPVIIDCGASMGLSLLYFSKTYPGAVIDAFEPDESILDTLESNIKTYEMNRVTLHKKAVWISEETLRFYTNRGLGGRLTHEYNTPDFKTVETIRLKDFIGEKKIDLLKIDIEGAEFRILKDCESKLSQIDHLFVEYHSPADDEQKLDDVLHLLKNNGFRYHLSESFSRRRPFVDRVIVDEKFD